MLLKLMRCEVPREHRAAFSRAQEAWAALTEVPGFCGQLGGWSATEADCAVILAWWQDAAAYQAFMAGPHDRIHGSSQQARHYRGLKVRLLDQGAAIPAPPRPQLEAANWLLLGSQSGEKVPIDLLTAPPPPCAGEPIALEAAWLVLPA